MRSFIWPCWIADSCGRCRLFEKLTPKCCPVGKTAPALLAGQIHRLTRERLTRYGNRSFTRTQRKQSRRAACAIIKPHVARRSSTKEKGFATSTAAEEELSAAAGRFSQRHPMFSALQHGRNDNTSP